jgi:hypothetical protein
LGDLLRNLFSWLKVYKCARLQAKGLRAKTTTQGEEKGLEARIGQRQQQRWEALQERRAVKEWTARELDMLLIRMLRT